MKTSCLIALCVCVVAVLVGVIITYCGRFMIAVVNETVLDQLFVKRDLSEEELEGYWVITEDSIGKMEGIFGITTETKRTDRMIFLKPNGTCVYRWAGCSDPSGRWYGWDTTGDELIAGPFESQDEIKHGIKEKTSEWSWRLYDYQQDIASDQRLCWGERYHVRLYNNQAIEPWTGFGLQIGETKGQLVLWQYAWGEPSKPRLKYVKLSEMEVKELVCSRRNCDRER